MTSNKHYHDVNGITFDVASTLASTLAEAKNCALSWSHGLHVVNGIQSTFDVSFTNMCRRHDASQRVIIDMLRDIVDKLAIFGCDPTDIIRLACDLGLIANRISVNEQTNLDRFINGFIDTLQTHNRRATSRELNAWIEARRYRDPRTRSILQALIEVAGVEGRITLVRDDVRRPIIERRTGHCFAHVRPFVSTSSNSEWSAHNVRVMLFDGACTSVAELDHIFNSAVQNREPLIIVARMFDQDVVSTVATNNRRGTFNIMLAVAPFDLDCANTLKDIAVVADGDVISSLDGKLLTSVTFDELPIVQEVTCTSSLLTITESTATQRVMQHVAFLQSQLVDEHRGPLIKRRIAALTPSLVSVTIPQRDNILQLELEECLRYIRAITSGVVTCSDALQYIMTSSHDQETREVLTRWCETYSVTGIPTKSGVATMIAVAAFCRQLTKIGCIIDTTQTHITAQAAQ